MATEVLLMTDVAELGSEGEVVTVSDGYARNFLFPGKLGAPVTEATRRRLACMQRERGEARQAELEKARQLAEKLAGTQCTIAVKTGEGEKLYGSVTSAEIAAALEAQDVAIDRHSLQLEAPIKELGVFNVKVRLHTEVEAAVKVWVVEE